MRRLRLPESGTFLLAVVVVLGIAGVDYVTGTEVRIFPLYFVSISLAAAHGRRASALAVAGLSTAAWLGSNHLAGLRYSNDTIWLWNVCAQSAAFGMVGYLTSSLGAALERERALARTDPLTGLLNARAFYEHAERALASCRRHARPIAMAYIDVDDFKQVNDELGHDGGNAVLRGVGRTLGAAVRGQDVAARMGGDEFAILLPETDSDGARRFLERSRAMLAAALAQEPRNVTLSIGAVVFVEPPEDVATLVRRADDLMYAAKAAGKDRFQIEVERGPTAPGA